MQYSSRVWLVSIRFYCRILSCSLLSFSLSLFLSLSESLLASLSISPRACAAQIFDDHFTNGFVFDRSCTSASTYFMAALHRVCTLTLVKVATHAFVYNSTLVCLPLCVCVFVLHRGNCAAVKSCVERRRPKVKEEKEESTTHKHTFTTAHQTKTYHFLELCYSNNTLSKETWPIAANEFS